jgi:hypothetical protein
MLRTIKLSIFFGLLFSLVFVPGAYAQQVLPGNTGNNPNKTVKEENPGAAANRSDKAQLVQNRAGTDAAAMIKNNLSEARLRVCESRQERIANRFKNLQSLGAGAHQTFYGFVERVDYYYLNTLVPQGYALENYDLLKADIASNEEAVKASLEAVRAVGQDFNCMSEDPKGQADAFRVNMQEVISANREYKASVRAFVAAVRDLAIESRTATLDTDSVESATGAAGIE